MKNNNILGLSFIIHPDKTQFTGGYFQVGFLCFFLGVFFSAGVFNANPI